MISLNLRETGCGLGGGGPGAGFVGASWASKSSLLPLVQASSTLGAKYLLGPVARVFRLAADSVFSVPRVRDPK